MATQLVTLLPVLFAFGFWAYCLADFARTPEAELRTYSRPVWVLILVLLNIVGGVLWLTLGRPPRR